MSDERKHSAGPFGIIETASRFILIDACGYPIGTLYRADLDIPEAEQAANAKLFRAAPDMLRALRGIQSIAPKRRGAMDPVKAVLWDVVDAVIRRAEGLE